MEEEGGEVQLSVFWRSSQVSSLVHFCLFLFFFILCFFRFYSSLFIALFRVDGEAYVANAPMSNKVQCHS